MIEAHRFDLYDEPMQTSAELDNYLQGTASALFGLGVTLSTPAFFSAIFATAKPSERGAASGTASVFLDLGLGGGPMLLGFAAQAGGIPFAFGTAAVVALAGCGWTLLIRRGGRTTSSSAA